MFQRIVVPLDGSELSERALPEAKRLATLTGARIHLIRIVDFTQIERYGRYSWALEASLIEPVVSEEEMEAGDYLAAKVAELEREGFLASSGTRRGRAARSLVSALQQGDLVVMASHGRGNITRWLLGSVAEELLRQSPVPVLLVKASPVPMQERAFSGHAAR
jgi:nucleotide-binding universal stress UspA family protein